MNRTIKGVLHNSFYVPNQREENLNCLYGLPQGTDMDMFDYEFTPNGELKTIILKEEAFLL